MHTIMIKALEKHDGETGVLWVRCSSCGDLVIGTPDEISLDRLLNYVRKHEIAPPFSWEPAIDDWAQARSRLRRLADEVRGIYPDLSVDIRLSLMDRPALKPVPMDSSDG